MTTLFVVDVPAGHPEGTALVRVHEGTFRVGDRVTQLEFDGRVHVVDLVCQRIWRYEGIEVDELEPNYGGRVSLEGSGDSLLRPSSTLTT